MSDQSAPRTFSRIPLFAKLSKSEWAYLSDNLTVSEHRAGDIIFREGDPGEYFYIIVNGVIEVIKAIDTVDELSVAVRYAGDFVGEMSLINDNLRMATIRAISDVKLLNLSKDDFQMLLQRQPQLTLQILRDVSLRLDQAHITTINHLHKTNHQLRLANEELIQAHTQIIEKEKLEKELFVAYEIQMSILPSRLPILEGVDFGASLVPARTVGGDMFDFIELDEYRVGVVIGDVSDKGVPSAIFMAQAKALLRAEGSRTPSPTEAVSAMNYHLMDMNSEGMFVTVIYGIIDCRTHEFTYVRAGHDAPVLLLPDGTVERIPKGRGQLLGVLDNPVLVEQTIKIPLGGTFLLFTDGATDVRSPSDETFGLDRMVESLSECATLNGQATVDYLLKKLNQHRAGFAQYDDITMVAIHVQA